MTGPSTGNRRRDNGQAKAAWLGAALVLLALAVPGPAQTNPGEIIYTRQAVLRIPLVIEQGRENLREIRLFVSTDHGRSWYQSGATMPDAKGFEFRAPNDGQYWFTVQTIHRDNRADPPTVQGLRPQLKIYVDTQPPVVFLRPGTAREGQIAVEWEIKDDTLDLRTLRLDYRPPGGNAWYPLAVDPALTGQRAYNVGAINGLIEVRLSINDRAGNPREALVTVNAGGGDNRSPSPPGDGNRTPPAAANANVRLVNSRRIRLNYNVEGKGKSGIADVQLWQTRDGRTWQKVLEHTKEEPPFDHMVDGEGLYGFTIVVRSGVGLGDRPPQAGDPPQVWVEVDLTKPRVQLYQPEVGRGADLGKLTISWQASDKNLRQQPITISYAEKKEGTWTPIESNLENTGRYVWRMKDDLPFKFFVRVEAADRAGNVGSAETEKEIVVDLAQPKGQILGVEPVDKQ
jgi:hypothetical protein